MSVYHSSNPQDTSYPAPRGNVLLLTCMDLRLLDNIVTFMDHDNLTNRYDQVVFAGAALGALGAPGATDEHGNPMDMTHWEKCFKDHLYAAIKLHGIQDVYILEHRNCGAYHKVFHVCGDFSNSEADQLAEQSLHHHYAVELEKKIHEWTSYLEKPLGVWKFMMDLRGAVSPLSVPPKKQRRQRSKPSSK